MPPIGLLLGKVHFADLTYTLVEEMKNHTGDITQAAVTIQYGVFIQTIVNFIIIGFCIFFVLKAYEKTKTKKEIVEAPKGPSQTELLIEIRDLLKK
jgi:large conductance mechanosensitive channel